MNSLRAAIVIAMVILLSGCATQSTKQRPDSYFANAPVSNDDADLFGSGEQLSDADIERILNFKLELPQQNRVAILNLSEDSQWRNYSRNFNQLTNTMSSELVQTMLRSSKVYDASFLPSMLVPESRTVPYLREAAARYQADLLLVYRSGCRSYQKYRFVSSDKTRAYCNVEAALLDTRKGIVPFTSVSTNEYTAAKSTREVNFRETVRKAELEAIAKSLGEIADDLVDFLSGV